MNINLNDLFNRDGEECVTSLGHDAMSFFLLIIVEDIFEIISVWINLLKSTVHARTVHSTGGIDDDYSQEHSNFEIVADKDTCTIIRDESEPELLTNGPLSQYKARTGVIQCTVDPSSRWILL